MNLKRYWFYYLTFLICLSGYFISNQLIKGLIVQKEITYTTSTASEVEMAWGIIDDKLPSKKYWPEHTVLIDNMLYTKMNAYETGFKIKINLPAESAIYYWMVQKKDKAGNNTEVWDSGSNVYFSETFTYNGVFKPGYFIFLSGFLPLFLLLIKRRHDKAPARIDNKFKVGSYIPQFDSLRAIAVLLLIIHHWLPGNKILNFYTNGRLGVNIFFVLSGFLITSILLKAKKQLESQNVSSKTVFLDFYIRRTLKIFPIYYLVLLFFGLLMTQK
jgi:hypothetical protein